jgi:hypothetical protein
MLRTRALPCRVALLTCVGVCGPLTPDPSPPFHGGEGRIGVRASRGRESAGGCFCSSGFPARAHRCAFLIAWVVVF